MQQYELAKQALINHEVIAFPTETVFGLGVYFMMNKLMQN